VSRGLLEFRADPESPSHDGNFAKDKPVIVYCAAGGRAALAGKLLKDMGYAEVYNLGGFKDWADAGGAIEKKRARVGGDRRECSRCAAAANRCSRSDAGLRAARGVSSRRRARPPCFPGTSSAKAASSISHGPWRARHCP